MSPIERSAGGGSSSAGGLVKLFDSTLGASASSIDTGAGGIAAGHFDLFVHLIGRTDFVGSSASIGLQFNGDTGANYDYIWVRNAAGVVGSVSSFADTSAQPGNFPGTTAAANVVGEFTVRIPSYDKTTFFKAGDATGGTVQTAIGGSQTTFANFSWRNTAAITRVLLLMAAGANLLAGSRMVIYGTQ